MTPNNISNTNLIEILSSTFLDKRGWIQPSISQSYISISNETIINGVYAATPIEKKMVFTDSDSSWFWTKEWQAGENKVEEYIREGNVQTFDTPEEFLRTLRE
jgi:hypothetical protein